MTARLYRLVVWPDVEAEIADAVGWYESQQPGLGRRFLAEFRAATTLLRRTPFHYQIIEEQIRRIVLHHFPYSVFYEVHDPDVLIVACLHTSRDPEEWRRRIRAI